MPLMFGTSVSYTSDLSIKNCGSLDVITQRGQGGVLEVVCMGVPTP
jgi:hypothetical protein